MKHIYRVIFIAMMFWPVTLLAADVTLTWDPVVHPDLAGYRIYYGFASGVEDKKVYEFFTKVDVGNVTLYTVTSLQGDLLHFFVATAYSTYGEESDYSNEVATMPSGWPKPQSITIRAR